MADEDSMAEIKPIRTLRLNSSPVLQISEPLTEEEAELVKALGGFDDGATHPTPRT